MWLRQMLAVVLVVAAACGGDADAGPAAGDYFTQLQRVSETAHIQERGLSRDLGSRLDEAPVGEDRMAVLTVYVDQSVRLYQDVVDALGQLGPPEELAAAQRSYLEAWQGQLDAMRNVREAGFRSSGTDLEAVRPAPVPRRGGRDEGAVRGVAGCGGGDRFRRRSGLRRSPGLRRAALPAGRRALAILSELSPMGDGEGQAPIV